MTKISWICDINPLSNANSGAELSEKMVINEGIRQGHDINIFTPQSGLNGSAATDFVIIGNASLFKREDLIKLAEIRPTIFYIHDFFPLCKYRLYYPDLEKCKTTCPNLDFTKEFMLSTVMNIFLSPLHKGLWESAIPELADHPSYLHPSPIDTSTFRLYNNIKRLEGTVVGVNSLLGFKGKENILAYVNDHSSTSFTFFGGKDPDVKLPPNATYLGPVPNYEMPGIFAQAESYIHLPSTCDPFCRTAVEAKLCGAKVITNKLVGATSYPEFRLPYDEFVDWISNSPKNFWTEVSRYV